MGGGGGAAVSGGSSFPAIFFDGEREAEIGDVFVSPSLSFKSFQAIVSQRIGISPHQISIYLVNRNTPRVSARKIPITSKVDFGNFLRERDCVFLAVLKRSRRERRRRGQRDPAVCGGAGKRSPPANAMLLRRSAAVDGGVRPFSVFLPLVDYGAPVRRMELERESDMMNVGLGLGDLRLDRDSAGNRRVAAGNGGSGDFGGSNGGFVACEECSRGSSREFHLCVYDTVTVGFRSPAGPIARPGGGSE